MQRHVGAMTAALVAAAVGASVTIGAQRAPQYQVDPLWPKPLPNHWILGSVTGVGVDSRDHVWIVHRGADSLNTRTEMSMLANPPGAEECCLPAPPVLEFDQAGNLVSHWGGPGQGYAWPMTPGGIAVDGKGNVWITAAGWPEPAAARGGGAGRAGGRAAGAGGAGAGAGAAGAGGAGAAAAAPAPPPRPVDAHILKFSATGQFLQQIGAPGSTEGGSASKTTLNRPANLAFDAAANELYVADGYGNHRIVVLDATTGAYKRHWGAFGAAPADEPLPAYDPAAPPIKQFRNVTCVRISKDNLVYVCDRQSNRIHVFKKDGTWVKEAVVSKATLGNGSVWDIAFSSDPQQSHLLVADGQNHTVMILQRDTLTQVGSLGTGGRWPGTFYGVGALAVDSRGNLYTAETFEGKRVQKFTPRR